MSRLSQLTETVKQFNNSELSETVKQISKLGDEALENQTNEVIENLNMIDKLFERNYKKLEKKHTEKTNSEKEIKNYDKRNRKIVKMDRRRNAVLHQNEVLEWKDDLLLPLISPL